MNEEDDILLDEPTTTPEPQTADEVKAQLAQIAARLDQRDEDLITRRDKEWQEYVDSITPPDPEAPIDTRAIQLSARDAAVNDMKVILATQEDILDRVRPYGDEAIKMAKQAIQQSNPETLKDPRNARVIAALIKDELMEQGKFPTQGVSAGNNGVSSTTYSQDVMVHTAAAGIDLTTLTAEEKSELRSAGILA